MIYFKGVYLKRYQVDWCIHHNIPSKISSDHRVFQVSRCSTQSTLNARIWWRERIIDTYDIIRINKIKYCPNCQDQEGIMYSKSWQSQTVM